MGGGCSRGRGRGTLISDTVVACLISFLGFAEPRDVVGCLRAGGTCVPFRGDRHMKPIGTCGLNGTKCCEKK